MTMDAKNIPAAFAGLSINRLPLPVLLVGKNRKIIAVNHKAEDVFGTIIEGHDLSVVSESLQLLTAYDRVMEEGIELECEVARKIRRRRTFLAHLSPVEHQGGVSGVFIAFYETTVATEAEHMRAAFVADVSHELRSPLTTLIAALETLKGKAGEDVVTRERFVEIMTHEANRMHRIVNDLLALSTTEAQEHIVPNDTVNLAEVLQEITIVLSEKAQKKMMRLVLDIEDTFPNVRGQRDELYRAFQNLVDNALKYGPANSEVLITAKTIHDKVSISVKNWGEVIPEKHIRRLTERFYRVDKSRSRDMGGTGLGLAIVKHIINRHLGEMRISSTEEEGTVFCVTLPQSK